jgi:hypothetical protein
MHIAALGIHPPCIPIPGEQQKHTWASMDEPRLKYDAGRHRWAEQKCTIQPAQGGWHSSMYNEFAFGSTVFLRISPLGGALRSFCNFSCNVIAIK